MELGRSSLWIAAIAAVAISGVVAANATDADADVAASAPVAETAGGDGTTTTEPGERETADEPGRPDDAPRSTTTSTTSTTTTTTTTTTTAAPTTTRPPAPAPAPAPPPPPPTTAPPPPPTQPPVPAVAGRDTGCESYMYDRINASRGGSLRFDRGIQHVAVGWSSRMAGSQNLAHNPAYGDQIAAVRNYRGAAENVGRGYELGSLFQAFMDSPGHRRNIENPAYSHVTLGCVKDGSGQYWVTQNFWG